MMSSTPKFWHVLVQLLTALVGEGLELSFSLPPHYEITDGDSFEYVVVGGGAAGCAAAARLALAGRQVLLIEAGGDPGFLSSIPAAALTQLGSDLDWQYETIPNNVSCLSSRGRRCRFSRGKGLGGSTAINYMLHTRPNPRDFDYGIPGWSWDDFRPYFLRYEGLQSLHLLPASSAPYHNTSGIVKMELFPHSENPWQDGLVEGFESLGIPYNADLNAESQIGITRAVGFVHEGQRMSTARAYLTNKHVQRNLRVARHTLCTGVAWGAAGAAAGVRVRGPSGAARTVRARREVVLSAGAVGTPHVLLLSGVGPAGHLREHGIPVRADLTVGDNMRDHVMPLLFITVDRNASEVRDGLGQGARDAARYLATGGGPLGSIGLTQILVYLNTLCYDAEKKKLATAGADCDLPSVEFNAAFVERGAIALARQLVKRATNLNDALLDQLSRANLDKALLVVSAVSLGARSVGRVRLAAADPRAPPAVFPNYLSETADVEEMLRAIRLIRRLVRTPVFRAHGAALLRPRLPCPRARYWPCYARHLTWPGLHASGTCALGSVLDARMRVRGVRQLRVADLAALPRPPRANTAAVAIAIGERVADFILQDEEKK